MEHGRFCVCCTSFERTFLDELLTVAMIVADCVLPIVNTFALWSMHVSLLFIRFWNSLTSVMVRSSSAIEYPYFLVCFTLVFLDTINMYAFYVAAAVRSLLRMKLLIAPIMSWVHFFGFLGALLIISSSISWEKVVKSPAGLLLTSPMVFTRDVRARINSVSA